MKNVQILALSGWSFGPESLDPVFQKIASGSAFDLQVEDWTSWLGQGDKKLLEWESARHDVLLFGWSLGAFLLFPLLELPAVKGAVFVSLAESFVKSEANSRGAGPEILTAMIRGLKTNEKETLSGFRKECFLPEAAPSYSGEKTPTTTELIRGLEALSDFNLGRMETPQGKKVVLIQGKRDRILPVFGARAMAKRRNFTYLELENAGHAVPLTHPEIVASKIEAFL